VEKARNLDNQLRMEENSEAAAVRLLRRATAASERINYAWWADHLRQGWFKHENKGIG